MWFFFFFKQKTAYEIYQCDWSSDVCSSDLKNAREAAVSSGLTPRLKGSAGKIHSGRITKHGPKSIRRATYIACKSVIKFSPKHRLFFQSVKERRGGKKALVALSRKLVALAWTLWSNKSYYVEVKI